MSKQAILKKPMAMEQEEYDWLSKLPSGTEVLRGVRPFLYYAKVSAMYDMLAIEPLKAPRVLAVILFSERGYLGQYVSLASALNVGLGIARDEAERIARGEPSPNHVLMKGGSQ